MDQLVTMNVGRFSPSTPVVALKMEKLVNMYAGRFSVCAISSSRGYLWIWTGNMSLTSCSLFTLHCLFCILMYPLMPHVNLHAQTHGVHSFGPASVVHACAARRGSKEQHLWRIRTSGTGPSVDLCAPNPAPSKYWVCGPFGCDVEL